VIRLFALLSLKADPFWWLPTRYGLAGAGRYQADRIFLADSGNAIHLPK
jgi:hypothetical protein